LSKFKGNEKDLAADLANIDIDGDASSETIAPKYMKQLVRDFHIVRPNIEPRLQQRIANRDQQMLVIQSEDIYTVRVFSRVFRPTSMFHTAREYPVRAGHSHSQ